MRLEKTAVAVIPGSTIAAWMALDFRRTAGGKSSLISSLRSWYRAQDFKVSRNRFVAIELGRQLSRFGLRLTGDGTYFRKSLSLPNRCLVPCHCDKAWELAAGFPCSSATLKEI